jgi:hypothetical protein
MQPIHATITTLNRLSKIISSINTQVITHLFIWISYRQVKQKNGSVQGIPEYTFYDKN